MSVESNRLGSRDQPLLAAQPAQSRALAGLVAETLALAKRREDPYCSRSARAVSLVPLMAHESFRERRNRDADERNIFRQCESGSRRADRTSIICINKR